MQKVNGTQQLAFGANSKNIGNFFNKIQNGAKWCLQMFIFQMKFLINWLKNDVSQYAAPFSPGPLCSTLLCALYDNIIIIAVECWQ